MLEGFEYLDKAANTGAEFLDHSYPEWYEAIDIDELDIGTMDSCILGQTVGFREFQYWLAKGTDEQEAERWLIHHGFTLSDDERWWIDDREFRGLTSIWKNLVEDRQTA